jgi:uracil-DNA glycosylase
MNSITSYFGTKPSASSPIESSETILQKEVTNNKRTLNDTNGPAVFEEEETQVLKKGKKATATSRVSVNADIQSQSVPSTSTSDGTLTYSNIETSLPESWQLVLKAEFTKTYFIQLKKNLQARADSKEVIYPPISKIFRAFQCVPSLQQIKVVLIGQDPYMNEGEAEGLCFSVPKGIKVPSSLQNIYKELKNDIPGFVIPKHGHLIHWAEQVRIKSN